jgi:limonene-1,2-epoxide hydrolase
MSTKDADRRNVEALLSFFACWDSTLTEMCDSYRRMFTADTKWMNPGFPVFTGAGEAVQFLQDEAERIGLETIPVEVRHIVAADGVVMSERVDHLRRADGSSIISIPVSGVFEMTTDGRIAVWREYADTSAVLALGPADPAAADRA